MSTFLPKLDVSLPTLSPAATAGCVATAAFATYAAIDSRIQDVAGIAINLVSNFFGSSQIPCIITAVAAIGASQSTSEVVLDSPKNFLGFTAACGIINAIRGYSKGNALRRNEGLLTAEISALGMVGLTLIERSFAK